MKKIFLSLLAGIMLLSCNYEPMVETLDSKQIYEFTAYARDWQESADNDGLNKFYHVTFTIKGLNDLIFDKGAVMAYLHNGTYQQPLPYTRHYENDKGEKWTKTIDFDYEIGKITFYVTNSDFAVDPPQEMDFRVVLIR